MVLLVSVRFFVLVVSVLSGVWWCLISMMWLLWWVKWCV